MSNAARGEAPVVVVEEASAPAMSASEQRRDLARRVFDYLVVAEFFTLDKVREMFGAGSNEMAIRLALHAARERMRTEHRVEFVSNPRTPGLYIRATEAQKLRRGTRFFAVARKKTRRALAVVDAVDEADLPLEERQQLQRTKDRIGRMVMRDEQAAQVRVQVPATCDVPVMPRRERQG